jgi:hypothetical protein
MPVWIVTPLVVAAALLFFWWADAKVAAIVAELQAIRKILAKLSAQQVSKPASVSVPASDSNPDVVAS